MTNELEKRAHKCNNTYRKKNEALILKIPVPIIMTAKGLVPTQSTVDFAGLIKGGRFIAYDAKETQSKTSFPLSNLKQHQVEYLKLVDELGGIAFFLIHFKKVYPDQAFVTPMKLIKYYWYERPRQSIPIADFNKEWLTNVDDYLPTIIENV